MEKYDKCDAHRLEELVTGDETWIYHFQPDSKAKNKVWNSSERDRPVIACHQITCCMRYSLIRKVQSFKFQSQKVVLSLENFNRESVLTQLVDSYQKHRPRTGVRGIKLLHDNAPAHKSGMVQEYLKESGLNVLDHPAYSPDLSPCDFWLFPRLKEMLAGYGQCGLPAPATYLKSTTGRRSRNG